MILAVSFNPALDVTYELDGPVEVGQTNRVAAVHTRPGGKALNVARVLSQLGRSVIVVAPAGGQNGDALRAAAADYGLDVRWTATAAPTRRTVAVWDRSSAEVTLLNEPGAALAPDEWRAMVTTVADAESVDAVVLSGSLPPGVPDDAYASLVRLLVGRGTPTFLDANGRGLLAGVEAGPTVVKPNRDELRSVCGDGLELVAAAERLRDLGAEAVVASDGPRGLVAATPGGRWLASAPTVTHGNPTGAGDACVAGLVAATLDGRPWPERLRWGAALGAAAASAAVAGEISLDAVPGLLAATEVLAAR
jgi:tagatose 6-phosphate kinase